MTNRIEFILYLLGVAGLGLFLGLHPVKSALSFAAVVAYLIALRLLGVFARRAIDRKRNE